MKALLPIIVVMVGVLTAPLCGVEATTEVATAPKQKLDLSTLLGNALRQNAEIKEAKYDIDVAAAQLGQAKAAALPQGEAMVLGAPMPKITGDASASTIDWGKWGSLVMGSVQLVQPLYTFGQIGGYKRAAESQIEAKRELANMKRADVILRTKEYYYGYLMARGLEKLVNKLIEFLEEAAVEAEKNLKKKKSKLKPHDVYHLKTELESVRQLKLKATSGKKTAERAVSWITATPFENLPKKKLKPAKYETKTLEDYLSIAKAKRPEFKALRAGQAARAALRDAKRAQSYPAIFVGGFFQFGWASQVTDQPSAFANDPFNIIGGGGGVGFKLDLEFGRHAAEAAQEEAERMKLKAQEQYAIPGIELEVKKAYWELEEAIDGLEIAKNRKKLARKWFVSNASGWTLGITKAKDLMEALQGDGMAKKNYIETVFALNMALARLSKAVGEEITDLKYLP